MSTIKAEIEAIDAQIAELRRQKELLKTLPEEPSDNLLLWRVRDTREDGVTQEHWDIYTVRSSSYWRIVESHGNDAVGQLVSQRFSWQSLLKFMKPENLKTRLYHETHDLDVTGPYISAEWISAWT